MLVFPELIKCRMRRFMVKLCMLSALCPFNTFIRSTHSRTLVFAAMDTTSSMLTRILHCLALNPDVQDKLRKEIIEAINNEGGYDLSHDQLVALPYLDAVVHETLRMYVLVSPL